MTDAAMSYHRLPDDVLRDDLCRCYCSRNHHGSTRRCNGMSAVYLGGPSGICSSCFDAIDFEPADYDEVYR